MDKLLSLYEKVIKHEIKHLAFIKTSASNAKTRTKKAFYEKKFASKAESLRRFIEEYNRLKKGK